MTNDTQHPLATVGGGSNWQDTSASIPVKPAPDTRHLTEFEEAAHQAALKNSVEIIDEGFMTNDTIQNFIDEQRWRPIEEAPRDGTRILCKVGNKACVTRRESGLFTRDGVYTGWVIYGVTDWQFARYLIGTPDAVLIPNEDSQQTHFRPIPTDTPADVMQIAIDALHMAEYMAQNQGAFTGASYQQIANVCKQALDEIEARIKGAAK